MKKMLVTIVMLVLMFSACGKEENVDINNKNEIVTERETEDIEENVFETIETEESVSETPSYGYTYTEFDKIMYTKSPVNVRDLPSTDGNRLGTLSTLQEVVVTGQCNETGWYRVEYAGQVAYVSNSYLQDTKPEMQPVQEQDSHVQVQPTPEQELQSPAADSVLEPEEQKTGPQPMQPDSNGQFPGPDSDNVLWADGNNGYEEGKVVVRPRYMYWNNDVLYAECYVVNGCDYTVSGIEVETLSFANDSGEFASANFGELVDVTIPPYMNIIWTFIYTDDAVITPNADLNTVYYYSNVYY